MKGSQAWFIAVIGIGAALYAMVYLIQGDPASHQSILQTAHDLCIAGIGGLSPHIMAAVKEAVDPTQPDNPDNKN